MATEAEMKATAKYKKTHLKRISFEVQKEYFANVMSPAIERSGESINGYIKKAIQERIDREV